MSTMLFDTFALPSTPSEYFHCSTFVYTDLRCFENLECLDNIESAIKEQGTNNTTADTIDMETIDSYINFEALSSLVTLN